MVDYQAILAIPTVVLALFSFLASISVCVSIEKSGYRPCQCKKNKNEDKFNQFLTPSSRGAPNRNQNQSLTMMNTIVYWMCIVDGCHMIPIIANWVPQIISKYDNNWFWSHTECTIIGVLAQFCCIQSPLWHILLAYHLGYLLCGGKLQTIHKQRKYHYTFVIIVPLIATIIPFILTPYGEGYKETQLKHDRDCWVTGTSQWLFIVAISVSLLFHYIVLFIALIQFKKYKAFIAFSFQYYQIVIKLSRFVFVYTIIRFFPLIERVWEAIGGVPYWLVLLQHLSIAILGMGNAIVWFWNQRNDGQFYSRYTRQMKIYNQKRQIKVNDPQTNKFTVPSTLTTSANNKFMDTNTAEETLSNTTNPTITTPSDDMRAQIQGIGNTITSVNSTTAVAGDL